MNRRSAPAKWDRVVLYWCRKLLVVDVRNPCDGADDQPRGHPIPELLPARGGGSSGVHAAPENAWDGNKSAVGRSRDRQLLKYNAGRRDATLDLQPEMGMCVCVCACGEGVRWSEQEEERRFAAGHSNPV